MRTALNDLSVASLETSISIASGAALSGEPAGDPDTIIGLRNQVRPNMLMIPSVFTTCTRITPLTAHREALSLPRVLDLGLRTAVEPW